MSKILKKIGEENKIAGKMEKLDEEKQDDLSPTINKCPTTVK